MKNEVATNHAASIPKSASDKLNNAIVRIEMNGGYGTGFFLRFKIKDQPFFSLWTNFHVISEYMVNSKERINIYYGPKDDEKKLSIRLNRNKRFIRCFEEPKDITVIQILKKDNISEEKFLYPELNYKNEGFKIYVNNDFYSRGYPSVDIGMGQYEGESSESSGKIIKIFNDFEFSHTLDSRSGCSGMPICLITNKYVIGIHKSGNKMTNINNGTFIGVVVDVLEKENINILPPKLLQRSRPNYKAINYNISYDDISNDNNNISNDNISNDNNNNSYDNISNDNNNNSYDNISNDNNNNSYDNISNDNNNSYDNISNDNNNISYDDINKIINDNINRISYDNINIINNKSNRDNINNMNKNRPNSYKKDIKYKPNFDVKKLNSINKIFFDNNIKPKIINDNINKNDANKSNEHFNTMLLKEFNKKYFLNIKNTNITELYIEGKNIGEEGLKTLSKIQFEKLKKFCFNKTNLTNIKVFENFRFDKLEYLDLCSNKISDINILSKVNFKELKKLKLCFNEISNIYILSKVNFQELKELYLDGNKILDINVLKNVRFNKLEILSLGGNEIKNIALLSYVKFRELKKLCIKHNKISDIIFLKNVKFHQLQILDLSYNYIKDINILSEVNFKKLKGLYLQHNNLSDIQVLENVKFNKLEILSLGGNHISDINILENVNFNELKKLDLSYNNIRYIKVLEKVKLDKLEYIFLNGNKLIFLEKFDSIISKLKFRVVISDWSFICLFNSLKV